MSTIDWTPPVALAPGTLSQGSQPAVPRAADGEPHLAPRHLFTAYGVELEYMLVDCGSLAAVPLADWLLARANQGAPGDYEHGDFTWSNELVLHVLEFKTSQPAASLSGLAAGFAAELREAQHLLSERGAQLMPTAMHPWYDPARETRLWPHDNQEIYAAFDRIFGCQGHGWSNLQSAHLNLPFYDDEEFKRLHAAVRLVLPLVPALAASSPLVEGRMTGLRDTRIDVYRGNARRVPQVAGSVIPEAVESIQHYHDTILAPLYLAIAPFDREGILQHDWLNARGAIARFGRQTIEIRLLDLQESPRADLAVCFAVARVVAALVAERWQPWQQQNAWSVPRLDAMLRATTAQAELAPLADAEYLAAFGLKGERSCTAGRLWRHLLETLVFDEPGAAEFVEPLENIMRHGSLATRILGALGPQASPVALRSVYDTLCECLVGNGLFAIDAPRDR